MGNAAKLTTLTHRHKAAARLRVLGRSNEQIADELGVTKRTVADWASTDVFKDFCQQLTAQADEIVVTRRTEVTMNALSELEEAVAHPMKQAPLTPTEKRSFIREALDRDPRTAKVVDLASGGDGNTINVFAGMNDTELAEWVRNEYEFRKANGLVVDGTVAPTPNP